MSRPTAVDIVPRVASGDEILDTFASALWAWIVRQAAAEERLTSFAFREGQHEVDVPAPSSVGQLAMHVLSVACDPSTGRFLRDVRGAGHTLGSLAPSGALGLDAGDRVALAARVGTLAASGLISRELESDRIATTPLGDAILDLIDDIGRRVRA